MSLSQPRKLGKLPVPVVLLVVLVVSRGVVAEQWYFEPDFQARLGYDDNVRFTNIFEEGAFSTYLAANARFGVRTEVSDAKFGIKLDTIKYDGVQDLNTSNQFFDMDLAHKAGLHTFRLEGDYFNDSTRNSELLTTGFVATNIPRQYRRLSPSWNWTVSERAAMGLSYTYSDSNYDDNLRFGLIDYSYETASLSSTYRYSERALLQASINTSMYEARDVFSEYNSYWLQLGGVYQFSETLTGSFMIGPRHTTFDFRGPLGLNVSTSDNTYLADVKLSKQFETMSIDVGGQSFENPSSSGRLLRTQSAYVNLRGQYSERMNYSLNARFNRNSSSGGIDDESQDRDFFNLEPRLSWRATPWWTVTGSYRYRTKERTASDRGRATSNAFFLTINYVWPRESVNRWSEL